MRDRTEAHVQLLRPSQREIALQLPEGNVGSAKDGSRQVKHLFCVRALRPDITHCNQCKRVFGGHFTRY
jgi:hypothetical protein